MTATTLSPGRPAAAPAPRQPRLATTVLGWACLGLLGATFGLGLMLPKSNEQAQYSRLIAIHPGLAWTSYVAVGTAAVAAIVALVRRSAAADRVGAAAIEVGAVFTALTLVTGSIWGRPTWGVWWQWDPRLTSEALLMAVLLGSIGLRRSLEPGRGRATTSALFALASAGLLPIVHFSVEWWRSLHQGRTLLSPDPGTNADSGFIIAMLLGFVAFNLLFVWMVVHRTRLEALEEEADAAALGFAIDARRAEGVAR